MEAEVLQGRVQKVFSHLNGNNNDQAHENYNTSSLLTIKQNPINEVMNRYDDDIVIVSAVRTPICKAKRGGFAGVHWMEYLSQVLRESVDRINLDVELVEDIQVGTVLAAGGGVHPARMAQFFAEFPETTCISTTNRQCGSGLQAVATIAAAIRNGYIEIGIGAGVESMTQNDMLSAIGPLCDEVYLNEKAKDCLISMGQTSENVAERFGITREEQDQFALSSYQKAIRAQNEGLFDDEIVPIKIVPKNDIHKEGPTLIIRDDGVRPTTIEGLRKLKPAFKPNGTTTAGNSSQISDGAAAVVLMTRRKANELHLNPLAKFVTFTVTGVPPDIMGIGPALAIPKVLEKAGLTLDDIDIFEINEAFASQCCYVIKKLGINPEKINPLGGSISIGHPLGATGARQVSTLVHHLKRTGKKLGVISMCIGTGMGAAAIFSNELF